MRVVYEAEHLIDAHLVRSRLEAEGIAAWVRGEHLIGAIGELPTLGLLAVCVADADCAEAERFVAGWQREHVSTESDKDSDWTALPDLGST